jgi:competence protein ComEC
MPLFWLSLAFLAGICLAAGLRSSGASLPAWVWLALAGVILGLHWLLRRIFPQAAINIQSSLATVSLGIIRKVSSNFTWPHLPLPFFVLLAVLALGAARYQYALPDLHDPSMIASYNDRQDDYVVIGVVTEPPDVRDTYTNLRVRAEQIRPAQGGDYTPVEGLLLVQVLPQMQSQQDWRYGDRVLLEGRLETPPEDEEFSYRDYLARQGVYSLMPFARLGLVRGGQGNPLFSMVYALKRRLLDMVYRLFPDPEASLLAGILLADPALTPVTALLLADGGALDLNPPEWIERLRPQVVLLSAAADDAAPDPEVQAALQGYTLLPTDRNGWIELTTDGVQMWVEVERR